MEAEQDGHVVRAAGSCLSRADRTRVGFVRADQVGAAGDGDGTDHPGADLVDAVGRSYRVAADASDLMDAVQRSLRTVEGARVETTWGEVEDRIQVDPPIGVDRRVVRDLTVVGVDGGDRIQLGPQSVVDLKRGRHQRMPEATSLRPSASRPSLASTAGRMNGCGAVSLVPYST
jgi:hypothetical protein